MARKEWIRGESVSQHLLVDAIVDNKLLVILAPKSACGNPFALEESGSSASVTLIPSADGKLIVRKSAMGYGIDGNGAPWLRRQSLFLNNSIAVKKTGMFVVPSVFKDLGNHVALELPYIASHSFGELAFANVGAQPLVTALVDMVARMATSVWTEGQEAAGERFIEKAHFDRMRRRVKIARAEDRVLDKILSQDIVILNGRRLHGFATIMNQLEKHPTLAEIQPTILSEIHGDLNIYNILSRLNAGDDEDVALVDHRGVPLLRRRLEQ